MNAAAAIRVLVVDDEPLVANAYAQFIAGQSGFRCVGVTDSIAGALETLRAETVELILLDLAVRDAAGLEGLRRIRAEGWLADVIIVTSSRDAATVQRAMTWGAVDYLAKPFTARTLRQRLHRYTALRARTGAVSGELDQSDIDGMLRARHGSAVPPKGIDLETLESVRATLQRISVAEGPVTAHRIARELGVSSVTVRRYLDHLAARGAARTDRDYRTGGRPATRYSAAG